MPHDTQAHGLPKSFITVAGFAASPHRRRPVHPSYTVDSRKGDNILSVYSVLTAEGLGPTNDERRTVCHHLRVDAHPPNHEKVMVPRKVKSTGSQSRIWEMLTIGRSE